MSHPVTPNDFMAEHIRLRDRLAAGEPRERLVKEVEELYVRAGQASDYDCVDLWADILDCFDGWCAPHLRL